MINCEECNFSIIYSKYSSNITSSKSFFSCYNCFSCSFLSSNFSNSNLVLSDSNGSILNIDSENQSTFIVIQSCQFINNSAFLFGGAAFLRNCQGNIENNLFQSNSAMSGGALYLEIKGSLTLSSNKFHMNIGKKQGGSIYYSKKRPRFFNNEFENNSAEYGENIASYPIRIKSSENSTYFILENVIPQAKRPLISNLSFVLLDYDDQITIFVSGTVIIEIPSLTNNDSFVISSKKSFSFPIIAGFLISIVIYNKYYKLGKFSLFGLMVEKSPLNYSFNISLFTFSIEIEKEEYIDRNSLYLNDLIIENSYNYILPIKTSNSCSPTTYFNINNSACMACGIGFYLKNKSCSRCPLNIYQCYDNIITAKHGFYLDHSHEIIECQPYKDSCL